MEDHGVDGLSPDGQVRMEAAPIWARRLADVGGRRAHSEAVHCERLFDAELQRERIARLRRERVRHHHPVRLALGNPPGLPADETVDRVPVLGLVQLELMALTFELVTPVLETVRPWDQDLTAPRGARLAGRVAVKDLAPAGRIRANPAAYLVKHDPLLAGRELDLFAGSHHREVSSAWYCASNRSSSSFFGNRKKTSTAPSRMATIPAV